MRDTTISADDLAIQAAKNKLAELSSREGYAEAMAPTPDTSRSGQVFMAVLCALFAGLLVAVWTQMERGVLAWSLAIVLLLLTLFSLLAMFGLAPMKPPRVFGAAVIGKSFEERHVERREDDTQPTPRVVLLDTEGVTTELVTTQDLYALLKTGDVGVAQERASLLIGFVRL